MKTGLKVGIDIRDIVSSLNLSQQDALDLLTQCVEQVTIQIYDNWRLTAREQLNSSRAQYTDAIRIIPVSPLESKIVLDSTFANWIEFGKSAYDIKALFERSAKVKSTKDGGWYLTIPFRFGTPGVVSDNFPAMPKAVYDLAKNLSPSRTALGGTISRGQSLAQSDIPEPFNQLLTRPGFSDRKTQQTFNPYQHKSSIYAGLQRNQQTYEKKSSSTYNTFRRVSDKSDPNSWIHSGIKQYNLAQAALDRTDIESVVDRTINSFLQ